MATKAETKPKNVPVVAERVPVANAGTEEAPALRGETTRWMLHLTVLGAFTLLSIVATWPMFPQLGGFVIDKGDPLYSVWAMAWQAHAFITNPAGLFDTNVMYPFRGTLTFDELSFTEAVLAAPLYYVSGNPVLSHNVLLFATFVLSGYATWLLVRELTGSSAAGFIAGAAFAYSFYRMNHLPHQTLINTQWLPLMLLAGYKFIGTGSWKWAWAIGAFFTLQALSGHYLAFYSAMLLGLFFAFYWAVDRRAVTWKRLGMLGVVLLASFLVMLPIMLPYVQLQGENEFSRNLFEAERFSNTLASFLALFRGNPLLRDLLAPFADRGPWSIERSAFVGFTVVILGVVAFVSSMRQSRAAGRDKEDGGRNTHARLLFRHVVFVSIVALLSAFLSLGPSLQVTYAPSNYDPAAIERLVPLPYALLHEWVPGFQSMRVVARIGVLTALALAVLAGIGGLVVLRVLQTMMRGRTALRFAVPGVAILLALLPVAESWSVPIKMEPVGTRGAVPPVYRWLAEQPKTVVLEYPMVYHRRGDPNVEMANIYQYYSVYHWQNTINGSTTIRPYSYSALVQETEDCFPCPRSLDAMWAMGVEYVVVHLANLSGPERTDFLWRSTNPVAKVVDDFILVQEFGDDRVYRLKGPREIVEIAEIVPVGASLLLPDPESDPIKGRENRIGGGYAAALGFYMRDRELYGDNRLSFGNTIRPRDAENRPEYALIWTEQDPALQGYRAGDRLWGNEHVTLYRRGTGIALGDVQP